MYVDHELAWLKLKAIIADKSAHGRKDLLLSMTEIEVSCLVPEGQEQFDPRPPLAGLRVAGDR